ncbi:synaptophysin-like protein 1 isoform X2 [Cuculus canorus]|uniref:synaptophysin-like protein 1 isoform X2 n=1 Tax=Cuculus canorus TaxID=55661 RepID=UPI0023AA63A6|nr:synaptophysin-like protein 1 isoform X2 [Cuculus canorus]XP_053912157.1 synaptophysin-like protein 1 isoform X2 [Cuculus canorus]XP_053912158.1 synaptophysin-like protein 1 isoform X2 [Cuculus canorus]XP_053912159.1 synaptophysin-like protein 1 isoform X2 [Cuculus canorus]XP_053912160.1 synaptophysin-like protein 1 isoform X2 [Cuculus canorus]
MKFLKREKIAPCFLPSPLAVLLPSFFAKVLAYILHSSTLVCPEVPLEEDVVNQSAEVLNTVAFSAPDPKRCGGTWTDVYLVGNFSSSAQFFVTLAVLVFLYCIAALVVYIGYKHVYQQNSKLPLSDLAITVITAFLWLVSTSAWAKALADIKISTGPSIISGIEFCKAPGTTCHFASVSSMRTLNVSVVFGLLNMALWAGNIWFVYKDTNLHNNPTGFLKVQEYNQLKEECKNKVIF